MLNLSINDYSIFNIAWNLSLLLIPWLAFVRIKRLWGTPRGRQLPRLLIIGFWFLIWFLFIPNTAYIITDVRHLSGFCPPSYYRVCLEGAGLPIFFFIYACFGWVSFVYLLRQMKDFIAKITNKKLSQYFLILIIPLIALGVLLGLIERWNSWDFFTQPGAVLLSTINYFINFHYFKILLIYTISFYILYYSGSKLFKKF